MTNPVAAPQLLNDDELRLAGDIEIVTGPYQQTEARRAAMENILAAAFTTKGQRTLKTAAKAAGYSEQLLSLRGRGLGLGL